MPDHDHTCPCSGSLLVLRLGILVAIANELLGPEQYRIASVSPDQVQQYYWSADVFVLASLSEGLPRVLLEALAAGLPCIAHDYATTTDLSLAKAVT